MYLKMMRNKVNCFKGGKMKTLIDSRNQDIVLRARRKLIKAGIPSHHICQIRPYLIGKEPMRFALDCTEEVYLRAKKILKQGGNL